MNFVTDALLGWSPGRPLPSYLMIRSSDWRAQITSMPAPSTPNRHFRDYPLTGHIANMTESTRLTLSGDPPQPPECSQGVEGGHRDGTVSYPLDTPRAIHSRSRRWPARHPSGHQNDRCSTHFHSLILSDKEIHSPRLSRNDWCTSIMIFWPGWSPALALSSVKLVNG
jgi:hypothetical protein